MKLSSSWIIGVRNRLPRYEEDDELKLSERRKKANSRVISSSEVDPNVFQKPGYNPFELKYRNVNEYPLPQQTVPPQTIYNPYNIKYSNSLQSCHIQNGLKEQGNQSMPLQNINMNSFGIETNSLIKTNFDH